MTEEIGYEHRYFISACLIYIWLLKEDLSDEAFYRLYQLDQDADFISESSHTARQISIGDMLYSLSSEPGFPELARRWSNRDIFPVYWETWAASAFCRAGYKINAKAEVRKKTEDFDFSANRNDIIVNVEVTALQSKIFSENNVFNALRKKRSQLPQSFPAVIFCILPKDWDFSEKAARDLMDISTAFFKGTKRINSIVFGYERYYPDRKLGMIAQSAIAFENPTARHKWGDLWRVCPSFIGVGWNRWNSSYPDLYPPIRTDFICWVDEIFHRKSCK